MAEYSRPLRGYFLRRVKQASDADDLVQEVFMRLAKLEKPSDVNNPSAYIFSIAANLLKDRARRDASRQASAHDEFDDSTFATTEFDSPENRASAQQDLAIAGAVIRALPVKTRTIFLLHRFDGLKYREIAELTGASVSTVEKHMIAALAALAALARDLKGGSQ